MKTKFKKGAKVFDIVITAVGGTLSVGVMLYAVYHFGLGEAWPELVLNMFYIACLAMIWMYFFDRLDTHRFNYWCSISVGLTVLLRDILFAPPLAYYSLHLSCLTLSVLLLCILTFFYAGLLFAVVLYGYFAFIDNGFLLATFTEMMSTPEAEQLIKQYGMTEQINESLSQLAQTRPIDLALNMLTTNIMLGIMLGLPIAAIMKREEKRS